MAELIRVDSTIELSIEVVSVLSTTPTGVDSEVVLSIEVDSPVGSE